MRRKPETPRLNGCLICQGELMDQITNCSSPDCKCTFAIKTCDRCLVAFGFDWSTQQWVQLEEVDDGNQES